MKHEFTPEELEHEKHAIEMFHPIINLYMKKHGFKVEDDTDLFAAGQQGLYSALNKWDPEGTANFETYASRHIEGAMLHHIKHKSSSENVDPKFQDEAKAFTKPIKDQQRNEAAQGVKVIYDKNNPTQE